MLKLLITIALISGSTAVGLANEPKKPKLTLDEKAAKWADKSPDYDKSCLINSYKKSNPRGLGFDGNRGRELVAPCWADRWAPGVNKSCVVAAYIKAGNYSGVQPGLDLIEVCRRKG